jgi:predicted nuclease of restriction endonuclease-like (RecB) superfamily
LAIDRYLAASIHFFSLAKVHGERRKRIESMSDTPISLTQPPEGYADWLADLKGRIHNAQQRATLAVNRELVLLYWQIGRDILVRQAEQGWGAKVIERLAQDLRTAFPEMKRFSTRNLKYMRAFAEAWPDGEFVQEVLAQLPWYHQLALLDELPGPETRRWYAAKAIEHNWSRNILVIQIETRWLERSGKAVANFTASLPKPQSDLARESLKDPYRFDFLGLTDEAQEREIENALVKHVTDFLLELDTHCATMPSPSAWPNTKWWNLCRQSCKPACPVSNRSSANWRAATHPRRRTRNDQSNRLLHLAVGSCRHGAYGRASIRSSLGIIC